MPNKLWQQYQSRISGGWKCISFEMFSPTGDLLSQPHGDEPLGRVLISPQGFLSAHIARLDRMGPLPSGKAWQVGEDAEVAYVARGMSMYCGYLTLGEDSEGLYWETKVEVCSDPARFWGKEFRRLEFVQEGGRELLVLRPKQDLIMEVSGGFLLFFVICRGRRLMGL